MEQVSCQGSMFIYPVDCSPRIKALTVRPDLSGITCSRSHVQERTDGPTLNRRFKSDTVHFAALEKPTDRNQNCTVGL